MKTNFTLPPRPRGQYTGRLLSFLFFTCVAMLPVAQSAVRVNIEIEINDTATRDDDYFCWTPVPARIRLVAGKAPQSVEITMRRKSSTSTGAVVFQQHTGDWPTSSNFEPTETMSVTLAENGEWTRFWIAGTHASTGDKDVEVVASRPDGTELASLPAMVRVRKDAADLDSEERDGFLRALRKLYDSENVPLESSEYMKHSIAHGEGWAHQIHGSHRPDYHPLFLVWHRALLLTLERELQQVDPRVTVPYWRFDRTSDAERNMKVLSRDFMGRIPDPEPESHTPIDEYVQFEIANPLREWRTRQNVRLKRQRNDVPSMGEASLTEVLFESTAPPTSYERLSASIELNYHNNAHRNIGGDLGRLASAVDDPLFFLLHANVDRAWAIWQHQEPAIRFRSDHELAYPRQGQHTEHSAFPKGSHANDAMWPWSEEIPDSPRLYEMPAGPGVGGGDKPPTPASMIDYLAIFGTSAGIGACYDGLMFQDMEH